MYEDEIIGSDFSGVAILSRQNLSKEFETEESAWNNLTASIDASEPSLAKNHFDSIKNDQLMEALGIDNPTLEKRVPEQWFDPRIAPFLVAFKQAGATGSDMQELGKSLRKSGKSCLPSEAMTSLYEKYEQKFTPAVRELIEKAIRAMDFTLFLDLIREFAF